MTGRVATPAPVAQRPHRSPGLAHPEGPHHQAPTLPFAKTIAASLMGGAAIGALFLRRGSGSWLVRSGRGAALGAIAGAVFGAGIALTDRLLGGELRRQLEYLTLRRRSQAWFVIRNANRPWLLPTALAASDAARGQQDRRYGPGAPTDGVADAFRHAYAAGLMTLRIEHERGMEHADAAGFTRAAGAAHEADGQDNGSHLASDMDEFNNHVGAELAQGLSTSDHREEKLLRRIVDAIDSGKLRIIDGDVLRPTTRDDDRAARAGEVSS